MIDSCYVPACLCCTSTSTGRRQSPTTDCSALTAHMSVLHTLLLLLHYISENAKIALLLHYNYLKTLVTSYFVDFDYYYKTYINH